MSDETVKEAEKMMLEAAEDIASATMRLAGSW